MKKPLNHKIAYLLSLGIMAKLLVDTSFQLFNPFLTIIAAGVGMSAVSLGGLVGIRSILGLSAPLIGTMADRMGYRKVMQVSLVITGAGLIICGFSKQPAVFAAGIILTGVGQAGFTPNLHAHVSSKLPYKKRAMGIGILEYSWALAGMIGLLGTGLLIEAFSWRSPFVVLGISLIISSLLFTSLPESTLRKVKKNYLPMGRRITEFLKLGGNARSAWGALTVQCLVIFSIMHLMIIHGGWLVDEYNLSPAVLGTVALIMGFTDLSASVSVSIFVDRIGKKKSVAIGLTGMIVGFILLPLVNLTLIMAVVGLIIPRTFFEFAIVSNIALVSEQVPEERGKIMSLNSAAGLLGITSASALGPVNYYNLGINGLSLISLAAAGIALIVLLFIVKDH
ncbi:MAG: MFS transporter [Spirochaetaceae bacterium]|nr:MFS transporter [Spirochaetaceae bacterium]